MNAWSRAYNTNREGGQLAPPPVSALSTGKADKLAMLAGSESIR